MRWLVGRLLWSVLVVLGAATLTFGALHLVPGDPVLTVLGTTAAPQAVVDQVRSELGIDRPVIVQYGLFMGRLLTGDLGRSYQLHEPVSEVISSQVWYSAELVLTGFTLAFSAAVVLAVATSGRKPLLRGLSATLELVSISTPSYWVGVLLLVFFSFQLHLFPAVGGSGIAGLTLPAVTLGLSIVGVFTQVLRQELERALEQPFVLSSRARGTTETAVRLRHALRHAIIPMIPLSGWTLGSLFSGAVVVETVFNRQGIGRAMATGVANRDLPVVAGIVVVSTVVFIVVNLIVDLLYRVADPRLREARL